MPPAALSPWPPLPRRRPPARPGTPPPGRSGAATNAAGWSANAAAITLKNIDLVVQGLPGCKFLLVGQDVWNLQTLTKTGKPVPINGENRDQVALSPDGKLVAISYNKDNRSRTPDNNRPADIDVAVWDATTGANVCEIPSIERDVDCDYVGLSTGKWLLVSGRGNGQRPRVMEVWDAQTGKRVRRFACNLGSAAATSISSDGRYLAAADSRTVQIYDIATGAAVAAMSPPAPADANRSNPVPGVSINELLFSPDGASVAALSSSPFQAGRLIAWDNHGTVTDDIACPTGGVEFNPSGARSLQWSPDGNAWLVSQHWIVDRKSKRPVWNIQFPFADYARTLFIDPDHLLVLHNGPSSNNSETVPIPWADIRKALDVMTSKSSTLAFGPGKSVAIEIECVNPRGDVPATKAALLKSMTTRLDREGIKVADGSSTIIKMRFEEGVSQPPSPAQRLPAGPRPTPPGCQMHPHF